MRILAKKIKKVLTNKNEYDILYIEREVNKMFNDYDVIEIKVKDFVNEELSDALKYNTLEDARKCRAIAYGAVQFAINNLFPCYNDDLANWWEDEAYPKFTEKFGMRF